MLETYLHRLDELLSTSVLVHDVEIVRRSLRDTEFEKVLHYRYRVLLANEDLIEMTERGLETQGTLEVSKYRHHWQDLMACSSSDGIMRRTTVPSRPFRITCMMGQRIMWCVSQRPQVLPCFNVSLKK